MSLESNFIFLVMFGLFGYYIEKVDGRNPYKLYTNIGSVVFLLTITFFMHSFMNRPNMLLENLPGFLVNIFPGAIIGDLAGNYVAKITGDRR